MKNCAAAKIFAHLCLSPPSLLLALPQLVPLHPRLLCLAHSRDCGNIAVSLIVIFKVILISIENRDFKKTNSRLTVVYLDLLRAGAGRGAGWRAAARRTRRRAPRRRPRGRRSRSRCSGRRGPWRQRQTDHRTLGRRNSTTLVNISPKR